MINDVMINVVVEGRSDVGMARRVVRAAGGTVGKVTSRGGATRLDPLISNYNRAARRQPYVVFRDSDTVCPVELRHKLLAGVSVLSPAFVLRVVHPMTEAWLLADDVGIASYFKIRSALVPRAPDTLPHAKRTLLQLCAASSSSDIREEMVREDGKQGMLFVDHLNEFAERYWDVERAAGCSDSLRRALDRIRELVDRS